MTRRVHPSRRTPSPGNLLAAAGSCLAAVILGPVALPSAADAAGSSANTSGLSAAAATSTGSAVSATASAGTDAPAGSGGAAMSGTAATTATTPVATTTTPTVVVGSTGGMSSGGTGLSSSSAAQAADAIVSASGDGYTLQVHASGLTAQRLSFTGTAPATDSGQQIVLQRAPAGATGAATWVTAAHARIAAGGSFRIGWTSRQSGHFQVRAVLAGAASATTPEPATTTASSSGPSTASSSTTGTTASATASNSPAVDITIFKAADATFYGPGMWGRHTACGEVLHKTTMGVANRTIKCGTEINVYFNGNEITVPVIDRGPYAKGVDWDLTKAAANAVGLTDQIGRGTVGTLVADTLTTGTL